MKSTCNFGYMLFLSIIAALGGFLFGYDEAVISGTISDVSQQFSLDEMAEGWFVGSALFGAIIGVAFAGALSDRFGRKRAMMLSALFLREPITWLKAIGVFLGLSGAILMIAGKYWFGDAEGQAGQNSVLGIVLCVVSGLSYAIYLTAFRNLIAKYKPVTVMRWMFLFSAIFSVPFLMKTVLSIDYERIPLSGYLMLAYTVFGATGVTYLLIPVAQKNLRPTVLSVYNYVQPITASVLALILGQDGYNWIKIAATVLVFVGVFCVTRSKSRQQLEMESHARRVRHWPSVSVAGKPRQRKR